MKVTSTPAAPEHIGAGRKPLLVAALLLTGLSMRTAVTSVGAALDELQDGLHAAAGTAGLITTLPVICFAGLGSLTPRVSARVGAHRLLVVALLTTTAGLALRALAGNSLVFVLLSVLALGGGAVSNVLMPSLVKLHFPDRIGAMTAVYTTALAVGATAGAGLTVPIGGVGDGWRTGIGSWALLSAVGVLPWLLILGTDRRQDHNAATPARVSMATLARSRTAWALTVFFAAQSMQAYIAFGWFARFLSDHGISHGTAGAMVAALSAVGIPISLFIPRVPRARQRALMLGLCSCFGVAYVGLALAPVGGAWVWMILAGVGGGTFPLALTLITQRARTPQTTAALSAFTQAIGYIVAGTGPLLFGAFFGATGGWGLSLVVLFVALAATVLAGIPSTADRYVDDEVIGRRPRSGSPLSPS